MERNKSPQDEITRIIVEFLEIAINSIVFLKEVYPSGAFERHRYMNVVVQRAQHPQLRDYIHSTVKGLQPFIQKISEAHYTGGKMYVMEEVGNQRASGVLTTTKALCSSFAEDLETVSCVFKFQESNEKPK